MLQAEERLDQSLLTAYFSFGGFLVSSFGYSKERSLLLFMPASAMALVCILAAGYVAIPT
jgi:hypothetical protein